MVVASSWGMNLTAPLTHRTSSSRFPDYTKPNANLWPWPSLNIRTRYSNGKTSNLCCRCGVSNGETTASSNNGGNNSVKGDSFEWDWNRWKRHFYDVEQAERDVSLLKFQLKEAVEKEDFQEAAKLKLTISEATSKDTVAMIMRELKRAIEEERYLDASKLSKSTSSGLVGWWIGYSKDSDDPFGRLVRISPGVGRFVARSYSPRQLVTASPGTPLFEIYVVKDENGRYSVQVVYLNRTKGKSTTAAVLQPKPTRGQSSSESESSTVVDIQSSEAKTEKQQEKGLTEEGLKSVINFLKERIPGLNLKFMNVDVTVDIANSDSLKDLIQEEDEDDDEEDDDDEDEDEEDDDDDTDKDDLKDKDESSEDESTILDELESNISSLEDNGDATEDENDLAVKLIFGGVVHNNDDAASMEDFVRLPAELNDMEKDSFLLHVPGISGNGDNELPNVKVAAILGQGASDLMPADVAKTFFSSDKVSPKVSRDVREIVKLAVNQAQKRNKLSENTTFSRLIMPKGNLDPFEGLYIGAFGPYGTEIVQLRRKFGHWKNESDLDKTSDVEFFEYVEATKLTGDLNVPAGKVTFRAKIGRGSRLNNRGIYPDELGVVTSYKGQGRIAEFGFKNPKWVEGELLQLSGKGIGSYTRGADLGFLYFVPEQSFLVLFNRLDLPE